MFMKGETGWSTDAGAGDSQAEVPITSDVWEGGAVVNDATPTERIVAYTNIENGEATPFHEAKGPAPYMVADETVTADSFAGIPTTAGQSFTFIDIAATEEENERTFEGSLGGAMGTFTCTVDPCTLTLGPDTTWALSDGWTFEADDGVDGEIDVQDADYLAFGYWNKVPAETLADFVPFYYGSMPYGGNVQALSGTATYTGHAVGGYQRNNYDAQTGVADPTFGHFIANVRLSAFFGGEDGMSTIDGIVEDFTTPTTGDQDLLALWEVMLKRTEVNGQTFNGDTDGGTWDGAFFGPATDDDGMMIHPSGVAGTFNATVGTSGAVMGAYGAER